MSILQMSLSAGVLVIIVAIIRKMALNRLPKTMFLIMWAVILGRLLLPVYVPVAVPLPSFGLSSLLYADTSSEPPVADSWGISGEITGLTPANGLDAAYMPLAPAESQTVNSTAMPFPVHIIIWLAGMLACFFMFGRSYIKAYKILRTSLPLDSGHVREWLAKHPTRRTITVLQSELISTPIAVGIFRPRIILPKTLNMSDIWLLDMILAHEYLHIKRFDTLWKLLMAAAVCIHWFNPLVWLMYALANRDLELSCDTWVLRRLGGQNKQAYSYALIDMCAKHTPAVVTGFGGNGRIIEERIVSIMKAKKNSIGAILLASVLVLVLGVAAFASVRSGDDTGGEETGWLWSPSFDASLINISSNMRDSELYYHVYRLNRLDLENERRRRTSMSASEVLHLTDILEDLDGVKFVGISLSFPSPDRLFRSDALPAASVVVTSYRDLSYGEGYDIAQIVAGGIREIALERVFVIDQNARILFNGVYDAHETAFIWPVPSHTRVSSYFGYRIHPLTEQHEHHTGIDIPAPTYTHIVAAAGGYVIFSGWGGNEGLTIGIDHGNGYSTWYSHNARNLAAEGQFVRQGELIGYVGSTGWSSGPHLHFEIRRDDEPVDPMPLLTRR